MFTVLDIGGSKVVALAASRHESGVMNVHGIVTVDSFGMRKGAIADMTAVSRCADTALRHLAHDIGADAINSATVLISGTQVEGSTVQGFKPIIPKNRAITNQDVMEVVNHSRSGFCPPEKVQIQAIPREFRVDEQGTTQKPVGQSGGKLEVSSYLVTGNSAHVKNFEVALNTTDKTVEEFIYGPLASGLGVLTQNEIQKGTLVLDIGATKSDLAIFVGGSLAYAACIPLGGRNVTSDLSQLLNCEEEEAQRLKHAYGCALAKGISEKEAIEVLQVGNDSPRPLQRKVLCEIIESRTREIAKLTRSHLEKSGYGGMLESGVVLTGGGSHLVKSTDLFTEAFNGMSVVQREPDIKGAKNLSGIAAAVGAANYVFQTRDELSPISGNSSWQDRAKGLWSMLSGKN